MAPDEPGSTSAEPTQSGPVEEKEEDFPPPTRSYTGTKSKPPIHTERIARQRERTRTWLALSLVALLTLDVGLAWAAGYSHHASWSSVKEFISVTVPPLVALVGVATGFYFAHQHD